MMKENHSDSFLHCRSLVERSTTPVAAYSTQQRWWLATMWRVRTYKVGHEYVFAKRSVAICQSAALLLENLMNLRVEGIEDYYNNMLL